MDLSITFILYVTYESYLYGSFFRSPIYVVNNLDLDIYQAESDYCRLQFRLSLQIIKF